MLPYEIVKREDYSYSMVRRMVYRIVVDVSVLPTKSELEEIAFAIYKGVEEEKWDEFTIFAYLAEMGTDLIAYYVAEFQNNKLAISEIQKHSVYGTKWEKSVFKRKP